MLQTIENQGDENYNPKEGPHSTSAKSSNENTPNIPKKSLQLNTKISMTKIQSKNVNALIIKNAKHVMKAENAFLAIMIWDITN